MFGIWSTASGQPATEKTFYWRLEFKLQDFWVGAFWKRIGNCLDLWICLIPCFPLHLCWHWHDPAQ
jgi:hypothetical protein